MNLFADLIKNFLCAQSFIILKVPAIIQISYTTELAKPYLFQLLERHKLEIILPFYSFKWTVDLIKKYEIYKTLPFYSLDWINKNIIYFYTYILGKFSRGFWMCESSVNIRSLGVIHNFLNLTFLQLNLTFLQFKPYLFTVFKIRIFIKPYLFTVFKYLF